MPGPSKDVTRRLDEAELAAAIDDAQRAANPYLVRRLCFVRNLYRGDSISEAAGRVGVSQPTGSRWLATWNADGIDGLEPSFGGGRPPKLDDEQRDQVESLLDRYQSLAPGEVQRLLEAAFGITYSKRHVSRLFEGVDRELTSSDPDSLLDEEDLTTILEEIVRDR